MEPKDFIDEVNKNDAEKESVKKDQKSQQSLESAKAQVIDAMVQSTKANMKHRENTTTKVEVQNDMAETGDVNRAIEAINNLALLMVAQGQQKPSINMIDGSDLGERFNELGNTLTELLTAVRKDTRQDDNMKAVTDKLDGFIKQLKSLRVAPDSDSTKSLANIERALGKLDVKPVVNIPTPKVTVQGTSVDLTPLQSLLGEVRDALKDNKPAETDFDPVISGLDSIQNAITSMRFPVPNYVLPFKDSNGKDTQVQLDASGNVPTSGGGSGGGGTQYAELTTTAPATGTVALGRYKVTPPILTDGQLYAPQLDASGNLKVSGSFATTPPADIFPATQNITALDTGTTTVAGFQGQSFIIGNPTTNSAATFALSTITSVNIQTTGLWTGSLRIEASTDGGTTYVSKFSRLPGTVYAGSATVTSNAFLIAAVSGCTHIRVRSMTSWTGTATIKISESINDHLTDVLNPIRLLDSTTSTLMTIKAASTAAVATDTSIVTSINPNTPLPAGTNVLGHVVVDSGSVTTGGLTDTQLRATPVPVSGTFFQTTQPVSLATNTPTLQPGSTTAVTQSTASNLNATVVQGAAAALSAGWPTLNGEAADTTGTFTNATQTTSITAGNLDGYGNVLISINGTYGTATAVFEGSDDSGTTWYGISEADRTDSNVIESGYTSLTNTSRAWQISNPGWDSIRVRSTAVASGTVNVRISPSSAPTSAGASVSVGTALPTGANTIGAVNIAASQTIAVTNTGTFATQPTIQTGTNSIGKVSDITTSVVPGTAATNLGKAEDAAHTTGDTGVMSLGVRNDTLAATTNTTADYTQLSTDQAGIVMTAGAPRALKGRQVTTITSSTAETTIITSVASTFLDLYGLILTNTSATATKVSIRDATAGGTISVFEVPATDTRGFMLPLDSAIPQAAVTNNWTAQCGTSVASLEVTALFVKRV